ncbi:MAG TPA: M23 family metallopeptidase [Vicinamibacteria bacterium]|nr:M23 family metallopeptidase [Vicinamibacteria bacterium]
MARRRLFSLQTVPGLMASGLLMGVMLAAGLAGWRLGMARRAASLVPAEPEETAPMAAPDPELKQRGLLLPVQGVDPAALTRSFEDARGGGRRLHHAIDILAPRGTAVVAVEDGPVVRLHRGGAGGISVYQLDPARRYGYYYAHLDRHAAGLHEGQSLRKGDVLGYVGTTGNAPPATPHLHFAIYEVADARRPWRGRPIDPYPLWR